MRGSILIIDILFNIINTMQNNKIMKQTQKETTETLVKKDPIFKTRFTKALSKFGAYKENVQILKIEVTRNYFWGLYKVKEIM